MNGGWRRVLQLSAIFCTELKGLQKKEKAVVIERREEIEEYHDIRTNLANERGDYRAVITEPTYALPFIQNGRLVKVIDGKRDFGWGAVIQVEKRHWPMVRGAPSRPADVKASDEHVVFILLNCASNSRVDTRDRTGSAIHTIQPAGDAPGEPLVVPVLLSCIESICAARIHMPRDVRSIESRRDVYRSVKEMQIRLKGNLPILDPVQNMGIKDERFLKLLKVS